MKRIFIGFLVSVLLLGMGCKDKQNIKEDVFADVPLETILEELYVEAALELPDLTTTAITAENTAYYFGTDVTELQEGIASEPLINVIPFSVCLLRVSDADKAEETAALIQEHANPNKWVCVGVDSDQVVTDHAGDVVLLVMAEQAQALDAAFRRLAAK